MKTDVEITEIVELQAHKMSGVGSPANGTPFLLLKAAAASDDESEDDSEKTPQEKFKEKFAGKPKKKAAAKSDSPEADAQQAEMTGESAKSSSAEADAQEEEMTGETAKGAVQDSLNGTQTPQESGHEPATGEAGERGEVVTGVRDPYHPDAAFTLGGETTSNIPDADKLRTNYLKPKTTDAAGVFTGQPVTLSKAVAVASLVEAMAVLDEQRDAIKDGTYLQIPNPAASVDPGSAPWESYDSATIAQVASSLAGCCNALDSIAQREAIEIATNGGDSSAKWDIEDVNYALKSAMAIAARLAFTEAAEGEVTKAGKVLSTKNVAALEAAHKHLTGVLEAAQDKKVSPADSAKKETINMEIPTTDFVVSVQEIIKAARKAEKKEAKKAAKLAAEEATKDNVVTTQRGGTQSNNGGEISESDIKPTKESKSDDVNAVKENEEEDGTASKEEEVVKPDEFTKQVETQLEALTKGLAAVEQLVTKIAKRPRPGGPSLDGQVRPAAEGRMSDATKSEGDEIEKLTKALDEAKDPMAKSHAALELTRARLVHAHETGQL